MPGSGGNTQVTVTHSIHSSKDSIIIKIKDSNPRLKQITPARDLSGVRKLCTPSVSQAAETVERGVRAAARLSTAVAGAENGLTRALLLLALATAKASPLHSTTPTSTTAAATPTASAAAAATSTPTAAASAASTSTTATEAPTPATTPTSTPTPSTASTASTATTAAPAIPSSTLAPLAPAAAAPPTRSRRSSDRLGANEVDSSSRGNRGQKRDGGAPLKERGTRVTTRGSYSDYTLLSCKEALLEEVNGERGGAKGEEVVPDRAKGVREPGDEVVESDVHRGGVRGAELGRKRSAVAGVTSAEVRNEVSDRGKSS
ncbi:unnamed protein product [Closterium sp. Naga37s-1]|nr:unnamed protein product [Closterium sp. Naga37s-1]